MRWSIYRMKGDRLVALGHVEARNRTAAYIKAFARWPKKVDASRPNGGFTARLWAIDHRELGKGLAA